MRASTTSLVFKHLQTRLPKTGCHFEAVKISRWQWSLISFVLAILIFSLFFSRAGVSGDFTSDKGVRGYFVAHQSDFQALADMALQDKDANGIIKLGTPYADKYRVLMTRVGAHYLFKGKNTGDNLGIAITAENWGDASKGIALGYTWLPTPPPKEDTVASVDGLIKGNLPANSEEHVQTYSLLTGHWYIVFQH